MFFWNDFPQGQNLKNCWKTLFFTKTGHYYRCFKNKNQSAKERKSCRRTTVYCKWSGHDIQHFGVFNRKMNNFPAVRNKINISEMVFPLLFSQIFLICGEPLQKSLENLRKSMFMHKLLFHILFRWAVFMQCSIDKRTKRW